MFPAPEVFRIRAGRSRDSAFDEVSTDHIIDRRVLIRVDALHQVAAPGFEMVYPGFECVPVTPYFRNGKLSPPAIVHIKLDGLFRPRSSSSDAETSTHRNRIMAVSKNIGFYANHIPGNALRCKPACILLHFRLHAFNDYSSPSVSVRCSHFSISASLINDGTDRRPLPRWCGWSRVRANG